MTKARFILACCLGAVMGSGSSAQELRPAPDYFVGVLFATEFAEAIAANCPELRMNVSVAKTMSENVLIWLEQDGFDKSNPAAEMIDATPRLRALQERLIEKHQLAGANAEQVCAAGRAEMTAETDIGNLLVEVSEQ